MSEIKPRYTDSALQAAYNRGYWRGAQKSRDNLKRLSVIAKAWRKKALKGFTARCDTCACWERHGDTKTGTCRQDVHVGDVAIGRAWSATASALGSRLLSHENFGCVNWRDQ